MNLTFITDGHIEEAIKFLVSADGGHLPYTDASGKPNHRLMGAAYAALTGGYRGNKYSGPSKAAALAKLKGLYKSENMAVPGESHSTGGEFLEASALDASDSHDVARQRVHQAIGDAVIAGQDMDGDDDGQDDQKDALQNGGPYHHILGMFGDPNDGQAVYQMNGQMMQVSHKTDEDGDCHLGKPCKVGMSYKKESDSSDPNKGTFSESCAGECFQESSYDSATGELNITVIKPGWSKNNRYYGESLLRKSAKIFEGAKMFADHASDAENKQRPEGSLNNWVAQIKPGSVKAESDGSIKARAVIIDPTFKTKVDNLQKAGLLSQLGVSIRAYGEAKSGEVAGRKGAVIESLTGCKSVDFVTFAAAGGGAE